MQHVRSGPPSLPSRPRFREPSVSCHPTTTCSTRHADGQQIWRLNSHQVPWCKSLVAAGAALALAVSTALAAEDLTISFKASRNPEIRKAQKSLVEAWGVCSKTRLHARDTLFDLRTAQLFTAEKAPKSSQYFAAAQATWKHSSWNQTLITRVGVGNCRLAIVASVPVAYRRQCLRHL